MNRSHVLSTTLILLATALSGCVGGGNPAPVPTTGRLDPQFGEDTGAVRGLVLDSELQPIAGAAAALKGAEAHAVPTREDGEFVLSEVTPGRHVVFVTAIGYASQAKSLDVVAGEVASIQFTLDPISDTSAYSSKDVKKGFIACGSGAGVEGVGGLTQVSCGAQDPKQAFLFRYVFTPGLKGVLFEMTWRPTQALSRDLALIIEKDGCGFSCDKEDTFAQIQGCCYIRAPLTVEELTLPAGARPATNFTASGGVLQTRTFPAFGESGSPATVFTEQDFTIYVEFFYNELPSGWTTRTNAPAA